MSVDRYAGAGLRWAAGATLVYAPIAELLVARCPHPLAGRLVLDAGAGTGAATAALTSRGARTVAADMSRDMLAWNAAARPPAAVADIRALPLPTGAVDDSVAAFLLNHLPEPAAGFAELVRVTRAGGAVLACVYSNASRSEVRDRVDAVAMAAGWRVPDWYVQIKANVTPILGSADAMVAAARASGLVEVDVEERAVDVGVTEPDQLVTYRFGQAHYTEWLEGIGADRAAEVKQMAVEAIRPVMVPYRPIVVFASGLVAPGSPSG